MKTMRKIFAVMMTLALVFGTITVPSYAATSWPATSGIQTYCLSSGNDTTVYQTTTSTGKYGTIYASDLVTIKSYDSGSDRFKVTYPVTGGTKTGYVKRSAITNGTVNSASGTFTATGKINVYRRVGTTSTVGSIAKNDKCYKIATSGNYTQVIYPISSGYKMGWIPTSSIPSTSTTTTTTTAASVANGTYIIVTKLSSSMVLDVNGNYTSNGTNVQIYTSNGTMAQVFNITQVSSGWYKIIGVASGKALDVSSGKKASGVNVQIYDYNGTDAQLWKFVSAGNGYYYIQNKLGYYLDVSGGSKSNGTNVQVYSGNQTDAQKWKLTKTSTSSTSSTSTVSTTTWQYPMTNEYVCGNDWLEYYADRPSRPYHLGIDIASKNGDSNVYAAASGTVAATGYNSSNGNYVVIKHSINGTTVYSFYAHLKTISTSKNASVNKGDKIGVFGNTGDSSKGTHLHFAIADTLKSGTYYGYGTSSSGNKSSYGGVTYYNPHYVIANNKLP